MNLFSRKDTDREKWGDRLPPGQKLTDGWPVLHYGGIPEIDLETWKLRDRRAWSKSRCQLHLGASSWRCRRRRCATTSTA